MTRAMKLTVVVILSLSLQTWPSIGDGVSPLSHRYPQPNCGWSCEAAYLPSIGAHALDRANGNAYKAVDALLPAATAGDTGAQISIAYIMQDRLNGHLAGESEQPFTWRETWTWWKISAHQSDHMAMLLGGAYLKGAPGLPQNEKLSTCLEVGDTARTVHDRVRDCFLKYDMGAVWK